MVVKERAEAEFTPPAGFILIGERIHDDTVLRFLRLELFAVAR